MKIMDYEERNKKFYSEIETFKTEIEGLAKISDEDRNRLYGLVNETVQRHGENQEIFKKGIIAAGELAKREWELSQTLQSISKRSKEVLNQLEGVLGVVEQKTSNRPLN